MRFKEVNREELNFYRRTKITALIDEFLSMNVAAVEIEFSEDEYADAFSCGNVFRQNIRRRKLNGSVAVFVEDGKPYLINKMLEDKNV